MVICAVFGCNSNNNKQCIRNQTDIKSAISYFRFPINTGLCNQWINKCSRTDKFNLKTARICSIHFNAEDFERNLMQEILNIEHAPKKLKEGAVPTQNLYDGNFIPKKISNDRKKRIVCRENKLMVEKLL